MKKIIACVGIVIALIAAFLIGNYRGKMHTLEAGAAYRTHGSVKVTISEGRWKP